MLGGRVESRNGGSVAPIVASSFAAIDVLSAQLCRSDIRDIVRHEVAQCLREFGFGNGQRLLDEDAAILANLKISLFLTPEPFYFDLYLAPSSVKYAVSINNAFLMPAFLCAQVLCASVR